MKVESRSILTSALLLTLGAGLYVFFRDPVIFTAPLTECGLHLPLIPLEAGFWSDLLRFTLPDALWVVALLTYASTIKHTALRVIALLFAPLYEMGQLLGLIWGTFDITDLTVYLIITIIFITKWTKKEKPSQQLANH